MAKRVSQLTELTQVAQDDYIPIVDTSAGDTKKVSVKNLTGLPDVGYIATGESWTFSSWNATSKIGVITVPTDATTKYAIDHILRFVQATGGTKYARVLSLTSTTLTVWMPNYTLNNEAITSPVYSLFPKPVGAPISLTEGNPYEFSVWRSAAATTIAGGSYYPAYDTEEYDNTDSYNTSNGRFTAPVAGNYMFNYGSIISASNMGPTYTSLDKNGAEHKRCTEVPGVSAGNNTYSGSSVIKMAAGDYVNVRLSTANACALVVGNVAYNWFNGYLEART
jgi:hypothetical protein